MIDTVASIVVTDPAQFVYRHLKVPTLVEFAEGIVNVPEFPFGLTTFWVPRIHWNVPPIDPEKAAVRFTTLPLQTDWDIGLVVTLAAKHGDVVAGTVLKPEKPLLGAVEQPLKYAFTLKV